jgi:hypothetical protein
MFGGLGYGEDEGELGYLNDLWSYEPYVLQNKWVFVSGSSAVNPDVK